MDADGLEQGLRAGLDRLGLPLNDEQITQLLGYAGLIRKWSRVYNLTAVREPGEILSHHLMDCLAAIGPLRRHTGGRPVRLLDVGSGAGLPGAVVAIVCPEIDVHCVDAVAKKAAFVQQAAASLQLPNLRGLHERVERLQNGYDLITSRAFASLADFVSLSAGALAEEGTWLAMKGRYPAEEVAELPANVEMFHVEQLEVPGLAAQRCLVWLRARAVT
jgi:16S rRNA (guanine527-N7)-methyltransferase